MNAPLKTVLIFTTLASSCTAIPVRSTIDSFGDQALSRSEGYVFDTASVSLIEKQAALDCSQAAVAQGLHIENDSCPMCKRIVVRDHVSGSEQVITMTPGYLPRYGYYGSGPYLGIGTGASVTTHQVSGREMDIQIFASSAEEKKPLRQVTVRSVGREDSVSAVAYEMCEAAFKDFPENLKGKIYDVKVHKKEEDKQDVTEVK